MPRPFGPAVHGADPNDLVQFDYFDMGLATTGERYILMVRDNHSEYAWLYPSCDMTEETAAHSLLDWCTWFGAPTSFMSDDPTHFKNETLHFLSNGLRTKHHFTVPYCPWSNGVVERLGKELLRVARSLLSELQARPNEWPQIVPVITSALNNGPFQKRNNVASITAFTGAQLSTPMKTFIRSVDSVPTTITEAQYERSVNIADLVRCMDELRLTVASSVQSERKRVRKSRSRGDL